MDPEKEYIVDHLIQRIIGSDDFNFKYYFRECLMRLPLRDLKAITYEKNIHILKSTANTVLSIDPLLYDPGKGDRVLIVFVTNFSKCPSHEIMYIIAHEFAHVYLGHYDRSQWAGHKSELEADDQVKKWGFEEELKKSSFDYTYRDSGSKVLS
jgi:hypothetical protein